MDYACFMSLLPVGDGSTYIDCSKAQEFHVRGVIYYRSQHGVWVRKERKESIGQAIPEREAFKAFMSARMFPEAEAHFPELFKDGSKVEVMIKPNANSTEEKTWPLLRFAVGGLVGLIVVAYFVAITTGKISASRQISLADLGIIAFGVVAISVLLRPQLVRNIRRFEFGTFRFELRDQLQELKDTQKDHSKDLDEIRFILETLVTEPERVHLRNLVKGPPVPYKGNNLVVKAELRRLRSIGLIRSKRHIESLPDKFDLTEWVELTDRGADYLQRIEKADTSPGASTVESR
jgi:hypothetical protein